MNEKVEDIARKMSRLSTLELSELSTVLIQKHDISATIYRFGVTPPYDKKCDLWLTRTGDRKLQLLKSIKEMFGLGLRDAKCLVDVAPCSLKEYITIDKAEVIKEKLEATSATIEIKYHD